jgi:hypothetical protein
MLQIWLAFSSAMLTFTSLILGASGFFLLGSNLSAPAAGFVLTFALDLSGQIFWLLDRVVNFEEQMVSVERIAESKLFPSKPHETCTSDIVVWRQSPTFYLKRKAKKISPYLKTGLMQVKLSASNWLCDMPVICRWCSRAFRLPLK